MARFKQLYRIIEDVVKGISWTIEILNSVLANGKYTLTVDCTAYLNECMIILIDGKKWEVVSFKFNEELVIKPKGHSNPLTATQILLGAPTFMHGTVRLASAEYDKTLKKQDILPMIYLYETLNERVSLVTKNAIERTANVRLFILMSNKFEDNIRVDYDVKLFDPLSNIESKLIEGVKGNTNIGKFTDTYNRLNLEQFGYTDKNGILKNLFADQLTALEMNIPLNINRCGNTNNDC